MDHYSDAHVVAASRMSTTTIENKPYEETTPIGGTYLPKLLGAEHDCLSNEQSTIC
jgi:hypothetical protein